MKPSISFCSIVFGNRPDGDRFRFYLHLIGIFVMANHKLKIDVSWTGKNFCCSWADEDAGSVVVTAKTLTKLKEDFAESLKWHIEGHCRWRRAPRISCLR